MDPAALTTCGNSNPGKNTMKKTDLSPAGMGQTFNNTISWNGTDFLAGRSGSSLLKPLTLFLFSKRNPNPMPAAKRTKALTILMHIAAWTLLLIFPLWILPRSPLFFEVNSPSAAIDVATSFSLDPTMMQAESVITTILLACFFYLNLYRFAPVVLSKRGWLVYGSVILCCMFLYLLAGYAARFVMFPAHVHFNLPFFIGVPNFFIVFGISLVLQLRQERSKLERDLKEQENERLKSELSFLRSQVSPHFIFNVLNGVAALARKKSDQVEESIVQLSHLMRYSLYNADQKVTVGKEIEYITNYIALQKLRFGNQVQISFLQNADRSDLVIEPMLLIPFVENAFKHGVGLIKDPVIVIELTIADGTLTFVVKNKFGRDHTETKDPSSGIGLQNVKRRLELLYRDLYTMTTDMNDNWFIAELKLILL
jgi:two-component system LytT family sensor kinase